MNLFEEALIVAPVKIKNDFLEANRITFFGGDSPWFADHYDKSHRGSGGHYKFHVVHKCKPDNNEYVVVQESMSNNGGYRLRAYHGSVLSMHPSVEKRPLILSMSERGKMVTALS